MPDCRDVRKTLEEFRLRRSMNGASRMLEEEREGSRGGKNIIYEIRLLYIKIVNSHLLLTRRDEILPRRT